MSEALAELAAKAEQNSKDAKEAAEAEAREEKLAEAKSEGPKPGGKKPGSKPGDSSGSGSGQGKPSEEMLADAARETELADQILKALAEKSGGEDGEGEGEILAKLREELAAQKLADKLAGLGKEASEGTLDEEDRSRAGRAANELGEFSKKLKEAASRLDVSKLAKLAKARSVAEETEKAIAGKSGQGDKPGEGEGGTSEGESKSPGSGTPLGRFADSLEKSGNEELRKWAPRVRDLPLDVNALAYTNHLKDRIDQLISELPTPAAQAAAPNRIPEARRREIEDYFRDLSDDFSEDGWNSLTE